MIGAKTLATVTLLVAVVVAAVLLGTLAPERLVTRGFGTLLMVGGFGVVVGTLSFRFWHLGDKSKHYFRWATEAASWDLTEGHFVGGNRRRVVLGENRDGEAFDLPVSVRLAMCVVIASTLVLAAVNARTLDQLGHASEEAFSMASQYCPDEKPKTEAVVKDVNEPGCELVRRAFALGYAKTLGDCAPKKEEQSKNAAASPRAICTRRQRDEPLLHYSYRLLTSFFDSLRSTTRVSYFAQTTAEFKKRSAHLGALQKAQGEMLASAPHASHHIWTNLPDPGEGAFREATCTNRYWRLPHRPTPPPGPTQASRVFEHILGQLLFEGTYDTAAGHCREYHVHWGAPLDACTRIAEKPEAFLVADGALADVRATLERYRVAHELVALGGVKPSLEPSAFVSFHCYFEGEAASRKSTPVSFAGYGFTAEELRIPRSLPDAELFVDRYDALARLLVKSFHYGHLLSEAGLEQGAAAGLEASFVGSDFLLTRLFEMDSIDLYLDPSWIAKRPDLLEVYPYERHLQNYVQVFRRQYRRERGRL